MLDAGANPTVRTEGQTPGGSGTAVMLFSAYQSNTWYLLNYAWFSEALIISLDRHCKKLSLWQAAA